MVSPVRQTDVAAMIEITIIIMHGAGGGVDKQYTPNRQALITIHSFTASSVQNGWLHFQDFEDFTHSNGDAFVSQKKAS